MLIIPLERAIDWRRPPVVTVLLVLLNVVVFFSLQQDDEKLFEKAHNYYFASELPDIELPLYLDELELRGDPLLAPMRKAFVDGDTYVLWAMESDPAFMEALRGDRLVQPGHAQYPAWRAARSEFDETVHAASIFRYGFVPADARPMTFLSHMFLHGDAGHLIGNMIFLVLVGLAVELALGSAVYAGFYILGGLGAVSLFYAANLGSTIPVVGASGAIAAVMGLYAILYGRRRIRFFYWLFVYFDYVKAPAYLMFFLWLGNELFQMYLGGPSNIAYEAHIGGLLSGALLALAAKAWLPTVNVDFLDAREEQDRRKAAFEEGLRLQAELRVDKAVSIFEDLHRKTPENIEVLTQLFNAASFKPGSELHHYAAGKLLATLTLPVEQSHDVFRRYLSGTGGKARLPSEVLLSLARRFAKGGFAKTAETILTALARRAMPVPGLTEAFRALAESWRRQGDEQRSATCLLRAAEFEQS